MFDALIMKAGSKNADKDLPYKIGYGGECDSPLCFVGFVIYSIVENKHGNKFINGL